MSSLMIIISVVKSWHCLSMSYQIHIYSPTLAAREAAATEPPAMCVQPCRRVGMIEMK